MPVTLKQLRYALALAEAGHFGRAAERSHISQPALSQQIRALELTIGAQVFDRLGVTVRQTPFGAAYLERARDIVARCDALDDFAAGNSGHPARLLRFGLIPTVAPYLLPDIYPALTRSFPELAFAVSENRTDALLAALYDGALDLALIATEPPGTGPKLEAAPLFTDAFVLATSAADSNTGAVSLAGLAPDRLMLLDEGHCLRDQTIAACGIAGKPASRAFAATSLSTIVEFVANGLGVTLLPEISLRKEAADPRIRIRQLTSPGAGRLLRLVWREATPYGALYRQLADTIRIAAKAS